MQQESAPIKKNLQVFFNKKITLNPAMSRKLFLSQRRYITKRRRKKKHAPGPHEALYVGTATSFGQ